MEGIEREQGEFRPTVVADAVSGHTRARRRRGRTPLSEDATKDLE
jgi:hypothetical protein